jgi:hypothetical protein
MLKTESVTSYLGRFTRIIDELATVGEIVDPDFMVRTSVARAWERSGSVGAHFSKNGRERSVYIYIYIYRWRDSGPRLYGEDQCC